MTITGNRFKRSEGIIFKALYEVHKILTFIFTGKLIKFGNFSSLPKAHVEQLIQKPYLWNSYSSTVVKTINNRTFIPSTRGLRYVLPSKMNFTALIFHSVTVNYLELTMCHCSHHSIADLFLLDLFLLRSIFSVAILFSFRSIFSVADLFLFRSIFSVVDLFFASIHFFCSRLLFASL